MKKKQWFYVLLTFFVIGLIIFRSTVIADYSKQKLVQLKEAEELNKLIEIREALLIAEEYQFFSDFMMQMYNNKETLFISDNLEKENNEELVEQFISNFESNFTDAYVMVSGLYGVISFIEDLEVNEGQKPQAQYWHFVNGRDPLFIESEDGKQQFDQLINRHITKVTYEYDITNNEITALVSTTNEPYVNIHKYMKDIRFGAQGSAIENISFLPAKTLSLHASFSYQPLIKESSQNKDIKLKEIHVTNKLEFEHR